MKPYYRIFLYLLLGLVIACEDAVNPSVIDKAVVEAYLYANRPIDSIKVSHILNYYQEDSTSSSISGLQIILSNGEEEYVLEEAAAGVYALGDKSVTIKPGTSYSLSFSYEGQTVTGETQVPPAPAGFITSSEEVYREKITETGPGNGPGGFGGGFGGNANEGVELSWDNPNGQYFYLLVENIEDSPEPVVDIDFQDGFGGGFPGRNFLVSPTNSDTYNLSLNQLEYFGTYRVVLYRVNQEYVDLYESSEQDSRNLNEPLTNLQNGLGIVTAFNSDTLYLEVKQE